MAKPTDPKTFPSIDSLDPELFALNSPDVEVVRRSQRGVGAWLVSPAQLVLFTAADQRLTKMSEKRGEPRTQVEKVRAALLRGTKTIYIIPADDEDPDAIEIHRYNSIASINLITLLAPAGLTVPTGRRYRYAITNADPNGPVGPALTMDLGKVLERATVTRAKHRASATPGATATTTAASATPGATATTAAASATPGATATTTAASATPGAAATTTAASAAPGATATTTAASAAPRAAATTVVASVAPGVAATQNAGRA